MIKAVDKNCDGRISYTEFRVMMGAIPLLKHQNYNGRNAIAIQVYGYKDRLYGYMYMVLISECPKIIC